MLNKTPTAKIWVFTRKAVYMQRIADYVRTGHQWYFQGVTDASKMIVTWDKLVANNPIFDDKLKAFRAREKGFPTGRILMYQNTKDPEKIHWILLLHGEKSQLTPGEKWLDATQNRVQMTGYELVTVTKEGAKKPVYTWRYEKQRYADLRDASVQAIRSRRDNDLKLLIDSIFGTLGFSGSREQAKALAQLIKDEWQRRRPNDTMPEIPRGIGWLRRKEDKGVFITRPKMQPPKKKETNPDFSGVMDGIDYDQITKIINS